MLYIETESRDAAFHFSVEEYFMQHPRIVEPVIMLWQTGKTVMLGNYQVADAEVNLKYSRENDIQIVRRSSGGGAIFTDSGTLLHSMIMQNPPQNQEDMQNPKPAQNLYTTLDPYPVQVAKDTLARSVVDTLNKLKIPAQQEGRNDITVNGKKVSGIAQYVRGGKVCSHCSLLYDADLDMLASALRVDDEKIQSKAIRSVRSRVANLKDYMSEHISTQDFRELIKPELFKAQDIKEHTLSDNDLMGITEIYREKYASDSWTFGRSPKFTFKNSRHFEGGKVDIFLDIEGGVISSCSIFGDFLGTVPIRGLEEQLEKTEFLYEAIDKALSCIALAPYLGGITKEQLLSCLFG